MIRVGTAGWDYPDWQGVVFPRPKPRGFDPLAYLAGYFTTIEINATFYRPAAAKVAASWADRVEANPAFRFTAKLWRRFTHERATAWTADEAKAAREAFDVLWERQRLGAVLLQFPWSFRLTEENQEWLADVIRTFGHLPLVLEVRHESWNTPELRGWLAERAVGLVNVDQPLFSNSLKPSAHATAPVAYVRLHGRNYQQWFRKSAGRDERYDYLYTPRELTPWVERIRQLDDGRREVYAVTNNHRDGKAAVNAEMLSSMLTGARVAAPPDLVARYPAELSPYADAQPAAAP